MIYLDEVTSKNGALRVISGSHRNPFHDSLYSMLDSKKEPIAEAEMPGEMPFGVAGEHMPCHVVESSPGDVLFFNQSLFHAAYHASQGRRYIALKFAAEPQTEGHFSALMRYSRNAFTPHKAFLENENPNMRRMVEGLAEWGEGKMEAGQ
jgi:ectoine hydroxylase-related dioxygenase (phytanoyl-CoA dioxygenase family)